MTTASALVGGLGALGVAVVDRLQGAGVTITVVADATEAAPAFADAALTAVGRVASPAVLPPAPGQRSFGGVPIDRIIVLIALASALLIGVSTLYFSHALGLSWLDALYFVWTTVFTVGYGDITPRHGSAFSKLAAMGLMLAGAALVAVAYAILAGWVVERRISVLRGHVAVRGGGHVIVAGAGHVGVRVTERLCDRGHRAVVVERDPQCAHIDRLRAGGCQVIVADAASAGSLDLAGIDRATALLALTDSDASNLRIALASRERRPGLLVVARLASPELSAHVTAHGDAIALSSVALASEAFAEAALAAVRGAAGAAPLVPGVTVD